MLMEFYPSATVLQPDLLAQQKPSPKKHSTSKIPAIKNPMKRGRRLEVYFRDVAFQSGTTSAVGDKRDDKARGELARISDTPQSSLARWKVAARR